jgi:hypothetical protein
MATLEAMHLPVKIHPTSTELPEPIRLDRDTQHHAYDPVYVDRPRGGKGVRENFRVKPQGFRGLG